MSDDTTKNERWLVFEQDYEGLTFDGEYPSMDAIEAAWAKQVSAYGIIAYGVIDAEPLRVYELIRHDSGLPDGLRGFRVQVAWIDEDRHVVKMLRDEVVLHYTVPPPPGYYEVDYPERRLEPIPPGGFRGSGVIGSMRVSDPL